jgi:ferric-dicitrate binding protein FerR (iron transport regulator)
MKEVFRKYLYSVLHPEEFPLVAEFLSDKKNNREINDCMKPLWEEKMDSNTDSTLPNQQQKLKLLRKLIDQDHSRIIRKLGFFRVGLQFAALLIFGLILSNIFLYHHNSTKNYKISNQGTLQSITAPFGARTNLILPDSSVVWLNSGTTISYMSEFVDRRFVSLEGEAFFNVSKNSLPFVVHTKTGDVEVKGTVFNVKAYPEDSFQTTLLEGSVKVKDTSNSEEVTLKPGQQAGIYNSRLEVKDVETDQFSSWKDGKLIFREEKLPVVAKRLERWYNVKIELENDKRLTDISYTGIIEMESFSEVLQLLKVTAPINFNFSEKTRTISITFAKLKFNLNKLPMN